MHRAYDNLRPREGNERFVCMGKGGNRSAVSGCLHAVASGDGVVKFPHAGDGDVCRLLSLWLDWRAAGTRLARLFTDYEPGIHWSQVQMQSGITGMNSIRIYNPMKQAVEHDPNGAFVRRWCPELRDVPDVFLHEPWKWDDGKNPLAKPIPSAWLISKPVHVPPVIVFGRFAKIVQTGPKRKSDRKARKPQNPNPQAQGHTKEAR